MVARRLTGERLARLLVVVLALLLPLTVLAWRWLGGEPAVTVRARMPEAGGWQPAHLAATAGEPLHVRLTSGDVVHGFAIGQDNHPAVDLFPGEVVELELSFDQPGTYTFYCTRWCGPNHWRMRGTIEVTGAGHVKPAEAPLYVTLGLDLDAPHVAVEVNRRPSAARGAALDVTVPPAYLATDYYRRHSPLDTWQALSREPEVAGLTADERWDLVAFIWQMNRSPEAVEAGRQLYVAECAACHGPAGAGDGVMAQAAAIDQARGWTGEHSSDFGRNLAAPTDFTDLAHILGINPARLQGKILRGGMGTGMPYYGPIYTEAQTWALVDYLWTFPFLFEEEELNHE